MVKRNFNTCLHSFLNKFVIKVQWISKTFFSFCVFMFRYVSVHVLLYICIVNLVLYGSSPLVLPPLTWYAWFFLNSMSCFFSLFCFFLFCFFYWWAAGTLEKNKFLINFVINFNDLFSVRKLPSTYLIIALRRRINVPE